MALRETVAKLLKAKNDRLEEEAKKPRMIAEWQDGLARLYLLIETDYLSDFIPQGDISLSKKSEHYNEDTLGMYDADALLIQVGDALCELRPERRMYDGTGRVVLSPRKDPSSRLIFRRAGQETGETWSILWPDYVMRDRSSRRDKEIVPMTKEAFQEALNYILR